jgi:hypothetical protein
LFLPLSDEDRALSIELWVCTEYDIRRGFGQPDNGASYPYSRLATFTTSAHNLRKLRLDCSMIPKDQTPSATRAVRGAFSNIRVLHLNNVSEIIPFIRRCKNLETLCISYPVAKRQATFAAIKSLRSLVNLQLEHSDKSPSAKWSNVQLKSLSPQVYLLHLSQLLICGRRL